MRWDVRVGFYSFISASSLAVSMMVAPDYLHLSETVAGTCFWAGSAGATIFAGAAYRTAVRGDSQPEQRGLGLTFQRRFWVFMVVVVCLGTEAIWLRPVRRKPEDAAALPRADTTPLANMTLEQIAKGLADPNSLRANVMIEALEGHRVHGHAEIISVGSGGGVSMSAPGLGISCQFKGEYLPYLSTLNRGDRIEFEGYVSTTSGSSLILLGCVLG